MSTAENTSEGPWVVKPLMKHIPFDKDEKTQQTFMWTVGFYTTASCLYPFFTETLPWLPTLGFLLTIPFLFAALIWWFKYFYRYTKVRFKLDPLLSAPIALVLLGLGWFFVHLVSALAATIILGSLYFLGIVE